MSYTWNVCLHAQLTSTSRLVDCRRWHSRVCRLVQMMAKDQKKKLASEMEKVHEVLWETNNLFRQAGVLLSLPYAKVNSYPVPLNPHHLCAPIHYSGPHSFSQRVTSVSQNVHHSEQHVAETPTNRTLTTRWCNSALVVTFSDSNTLPMGSSAACVGGGGSVCRTHSRD